MRNDERKKLLEQKRILDIMNVPYLSPYDKVVVNYVALGILEIETSTAIKGETISLGKAFMDGTSYLISVFGEEVIDNVTSLFSVKCKSIYNDPFNFNCFVGFNVDCEKGIVDYNSGVVNEICVPKEFDSTASVFLGHELIHGIKDTNFDEFILVFKLGEVIPLFFELVACHNNDELYKRVLNIRIKVLQNNWDNFVRNLNEMKKNKDVKDLLKIKLNSNGNYLNSFYYALVLYEMYKSDSEMILSIIRRVLNREITTLDMLNELGIYQKDNNVLFDRGMEEVKKVLK